MSSSFSQPKVDKPKSPPHVHLASPIANTITKQSPAADPKDVELPKNDYAELPKNNYTPETSEQNESESDNDNDEPYDMDISFINTIPLEVEFTKESVAHAEGAQSDQSEENESSLTKKRKVESLLEVGSSKEQKMTGSIAKLVEEYVFPLN
ncbi:hypothetical protein LXL04_007645 [Taraxacum kok-saghyz]